KMESGDLPAVADIERLDGTSPEDMRKELRAFLKTVQNKTHVKPIIYTNISFYKDYLAGYFDGYPLWIAHYYQSELKTGGHLSWQFWQHSDRAKVSGVNHVVDFNVFSGDSLAFERLLVR
uniref:GH25 family lysozyme n=1 Tax=Mucilaginibacter sp. TaxID=1882438 RepID=UPI0035BC3389